MTSEKIGVPDHILLKPGKLNGDMKNGMTLVTPWGWLGKQYLLREE